jgi:tRNA A37 threonylcarbamoyltransferase TsaD
MNEVKTGQDVPLLQFPFVSLLATGAHTEIVLNRGVGLHTILGISIDTAIGLCLDKAFIMFKKFERTLKNDDNI